MPPFGGLYDQRTLVEESLREDEYIVFHAGDPETAVRLSYAAYEDLEDAIPLAFSVSAGP